MKAMKRRMERLKFHGLFMKMFVVLLLSIVSVSLLTSWSTIRISERLFIDTFSITNAKVISQIKSGFESFNESVSTSIINIQQSGTVRQFLTEGATDSAALFKSYYSMSKQVKPSSSNLDAYDVDLLLLGNNGRTYSTNRNIWSVTDEQLKASPLTKSVQSAPDRLQYQFHYDPEHGEQKPFIVAAKALMDRTTRKVYGSLYVAIPESQLRSFYSSYTSRGNSVVILSKSGFIISSNDSALIGQEAPDLLRHAVDIQQRGLSFKEAEFMGKKDLILAQDLSFYDMYIVNLIDKQWALGQLIDTRSILLICVAIVAGALIVVFFITRRMTKSLTRLVKQISTISKYEFHHYVKVSGSYETRQLAQAFNFMLDELHEYVEQLVQTQQKQRQAELAALQRQINPHFLYNTLASIKFMVKQGSREKAAETINALISLLQNAIGNISETVTVDQELDNLKHYVFINQVRYGERIRVQYFVSEDCKEASLPKLIIQPFIENAFFHAFNTKPEGHVYVTITREGETLACEVADNGDGMDMSEPRPKSSKSRRQLFTGIGVSNVHDRLILLYGEPYGISIHSVKGEGTRVRIRIPFQKI